jgi:hypothetical protein
MADTAQLTITGTLKTTGGTPVAGAPLTFSDSANDLIPGTTTDAGGNYSIVATVAAPATNLVVTVKFAGTATEGPSQASSQAVNILVGTMLVINVGVV